MAKKLPLILLMALPYVMPVQSRADDKHKDKNKDKEKDSPASVVSTSKNSVPLDGGVVFLVVAGLGLGAKLLYDVRAKKKVSGGL